MRLFKKKLNKPTMYTMETCEYCKKVVKTLEDINMPFIEKDVDENRKEWNNVASITNLPTTPTLFYNKTYLCPIRDFNNPTQLIDILNFLKNQKINRDIPTFELIKTINYNMSIAFKSMQEAMNKLEQNTAGGHPMNNIKKEKDEHKSTD